MLTFNVEMLLFLRFLLFAVVVEEGGFWEFLGLFVFGCKGLVNCVAIVVALCYVALAVAVGIVAVDVLVCVLHWCFWVWWLSSLGHWSISLGRKFGGEFFRTDVGWRSCFTFVQQRWSCCFETTLCMSMCHLQLCHNFVIWVKLGVHLDLMCCTLAEQLYRMTECGSIIGIIHEYTYVFYPSTSLWTGHKLPRCRGGQQVSDQLDEVLTACQKPRLLESKNTWILTSNATLRNIDFVKFFGHTSTEFRTTLTWISSLDSPRIIGSVFRSSVSVLICFDIHSTFSSIRKILMALGIVQLLVLHHFCNMISSNMK